MSQESFNEDVEIGGVKPQRWRDNSSFPNGTGSRPSLYDVSRTMNRLRSSFTGLVDHNKNGYGSISLHKVDKHILNNNSINIEAYESTIPSSPKSSKRTALRAAVGQVPAVLIIGLFHLMIGIPFGVSYFPIGWSNTIDQTNLNNDALSSQETIQGPFPLPGKEALGIRMFLFATLVGQLVFTFSSQFDNPIGLQMVENVPFCQALASNVIHRVGYGMDALTTLVVMFGLSSLIVGSVFYLLGKFQLGRIIYYFPNHVLVGCIGGIGLFIVKTGLEVTLNAPFNVHTLCQPHQRNLWLVVLAFELGLRVLERITKHRYSLLSPCYFLMITPVFYIALNLLNVTVIQASEAGYFFPSLSSGSSSSHSYSFTALLQDPTLWEYWTVVGMGRVSWQAILDSIPTLLALTLFSLIHVPINIPAFAISTNTEVDMNNELLAHGYSNLAAGLFGGLQNYMAYTQSVLYDKSGGRGKASGIAVALVTAIIYVIGPTIASYIPRCMAGTLLMHVGIDLFLEGVYDSRGKFDKLEYLGIWLIAIVMIVYGMDAAMVAGVIAAVSTYAVQNITYMSPIRGHMSAATLRSSQWNRNRESQAILDRAETGRSHILVIQLQGHLFFGNMAHFVDSMHALLQSQKPWILILDCSLVLGIDSSAAQAMVKLKNHILGKHAIPLCFFVSGSSLGFPCEVNLSKELSTRKDSSSNNPPLIKSSSDAEFGLSSDSTNDTTTSLILDGAATDSFCFEGCYVCESLDAALVFAENALVARQDPSLLEPELSRLNSENIILDGAGTGVYPWLSYRGNAHPKTTENMTLDEEHEVALQYLTSLCFTATDSFPNLENDVKALLGHFDRQVYRQGEFLWRQCDASDSCKLLLRGELIALLENEAGTSERIAAGNMLGEFGLVRGVSRMNSVQCLSKEAVLYSLSRQVFENTLDPRLARLIDLLCVHYLGNRVQHVSNRIFETRCLPI